MVSFRTVAVTDPTAALMLADYFASRAATFPVAMGVYQTPVPDPAHFRSPRGAFLIATSEDGSFDLGCGGIRFIDHLSGATRFEVKHLWVVPTARGTGIGRALLNELETRARAFGASELVLDTNATQAIAGQLYRSSGYEQIAPYNTNVNATHWFAKNLTTELE